MPPIVGIIAGAIVGEIVGGALIAAGGIFAAEIFGVAVGTLVGQAVGGLVSMLVSSKFADKPENQTFQSYEQNLRGRNFTVRQPIVNWRVVYGRCRIGGALTFMDVSADETVLNMVITFTGHEIEGYDEIWLNDTRVSVSADTGEVLTEPWFHELPGSSQPYTANIWETGNVPAAPHQVVLSQTPTNYFVWIGPTVELLGVQNELISYSVYGAGEGMDYTEWKYNWNYDIATKTVTFNAAAEGLPYRIFYQYAAVGPYMTGSYAHIWGSNGDENETTQPFPNLVTETGGKWSNTHRQTGRSKLWVKLDYNRDAFYTGIPNVSAVILGKKVYDPRTATTIWSENAALCIADYLCDTTYGLGMDYATEIDEDSLIAAANICDELVDIGLGGQIRRYTCNGSFEVNETPAAILGWMLTAMDGSISFLGGKWYFAPAAYVTPTVTLNETHIIGGIQIQPRLDKRDMMNGVKGVYVDPLNNWQPSDFPPIQSSAYIAEDQGEVIWREIDLPFTTNAPTAQRISKIELLKARQQIVVQLSCRLEGYQVVPGETVMLTIAKYGWTNKVFQVVSMALSPQQSENGILLLCNLVLRETASAVFDWSTNEESVVDFAPDSNLPSAFTVPTLSNLTLASGTAYLLKGGDGTIISRIFASWDTPSVRSYRIELAWKKSADNEWQSRIVGGDATYDYVAPVLDGVSYDVRVRSVSALGVSGAWTTVSGHTVIGKTAPPSNVTGFSYVHQNTRTILTWNAISDADADLYEIRQGASWDAGTVVYSGRTISADVGALAAGTVTFWIKAIDTSGNESTTETQLDVTVNAPSSPSPSYTFQTNQVVVSWSAVSGSYAAERYEVRYGASWAGGTLVAKVDGTEVRASALWTGSRTFMVRAVDHAGNESVEGSVVATVDDLDAPTVTATVLGELVRITWTDVSGTGSLDVSQYEVRYGTDFASGTSVGTVKGNSLTVKVDWFGAREFFVAGVDLRGVAGAAGSDIATIVGADAPMVANEFISVKSQLTWNAPAGGTLPIKGYEIRHGASFAAGTFVAITDALSYRVPVDWTGARTFWVAAVDINGNYGSGGSTVATVNVAGAPTVTGAIVLALMELSWNEPPATLPIEEYELRYGVGSDTWGSATTYGRVKGTKFSIEVDWSGERKWFVSAVDLNGNVGADGSTTLTINPPAAVNVVAQTVDNNVLLYWSEALATLPVRTYEIRRGATYAGSTLVGNKSGGFTTIFETASGTFTYWITGIDSAGNLGTPSARTVTVSQPPDFVFLIDYDSTFSDNFSNAFLDTGTGYVLLPVETGETWAQHFSNNSWTDIDDQLTAGYEIYIEPSVASGYYEELIDYGALIPNTKITVTPTGAVIDGTPTLTCKISVSDDDVSYTDYDNTYEVYATNFRYIKVRITVASSGGDDVYELQQLNVRLDAKLLSDAGVVNARAGGSVTSITRTGTTATVTTSGTHGKVTGDYVEIAGANETDYNGIFEVTVTDTTHFTYEVANSPSSPATGTITWDNGGTPVLFTQPFVDVNSITVTPKGTSAVIAIYDFTDIANPTYFKVLLFTTGGSRTSGDASWNVRGY